ncbi:ribonuclease H family protein [Spirulina subsalsa]
MAWGEFNPDLTHSELTQVMIYTDGACLGNPGVGGWAALLIYRSRTKEIVGSESSPTTNNRMEMKAAIEGLKALKRPCRVQLYSDSQLLINTMNYNWKKKANQDLWHELDELNSIHQVEWIWVKGHADNVFNNRVDELAFQAAKTVNS